MDRAKQAAKLLEYLDYGDFYASARGESQTFHRNVNLNPFPLLAYQKIYQDYYRNSQWEQAYAPAFNLDYISGSAESLNIPVSSIVGDTNVINKTMNMFDMRYSNWNKDLFMGVLPNAQYGDAASIFLSNEGVVNNYTDAKDLSLYGKISPSIYGNDEINNMYLLYPPSSSVQLASDSNYGRIQSIGDTPSTTLVDTSTRYALDAASISSIASALGLGSGSISSAFSILALRQAEALQKWKEITQSQQQDYKNQIEAHFGVSMSDAYSERCKYIDGSVSSLDISEVTNTNITSDNAADIAGKGVGVGDAVMNFSSDVHGYLICIYHAVPLLDYALDGIPKMNLKTMVTDYAIPEFDKTGMVQVPLVEYGNGSWIDGAGAELLGYAPRYYDYKTSVDRVHGAFINGGLGAWVAPINPQYMRSMFLASASVGTEYRKFKVNPAVLNPIFSMSVGDDTDSDQLLVNASFDLTLVRNLDRNGLPY